MYYAILPVTVSKSLGQVYNKQMVIAAFEKPSKNGRMKPDRMIPIEGTQKQADKLKNRFETDYIPKYFDFIDLNDLEVTMGANNCPLVYGTEQEAKIAKYLMMDNIKKFFEERTSRIIKTMNDNLPKGLDERIEQIKDQYPEYII